MKLIVLFLVLQSSFAFAEKKVDGKDLSVLGKIDEENFKKVEPSKPNFESDNKGSRFSMSCKDSSGKEFKKGEQGYETCLSGIKTQHDLNKLNSGMNKKDNKDGNSASFNFKIGE